MVILIAGVSFFVMRERPEVVFTRINDEEGTLILSNKTYRVRIADTEEKRAQGLSGVPSLKKDEGMLFIFPTEGLHSFWMKDMNFALDLVWIDSSWNVASTTKNATPESFPKLFYPPQPVQYVLEIPTP